MLRLVLFDFDGVIADSERAHFEAIAQTLQQENIEFLWDDYCTKYLGYTDEDCFGAVLADRGKPVSGSRIVEMIEYKGKLFNQAMRDGCVILPGVPDLLKKLAEAGIYSSICSGAMRHEIDQILALSGLDDCFTHIVAADDVNAGKPDPEGYLLALECTNKVLNNADPITAGECLVVEDSTWGVQAAGAAKMKCLAVTNSYPPEALRQADMVVDSLAGLAIEQLSAILEA